MKFSHKKEDFIHNFNCKHEFFPLSLAMLINLSLRVSHCWEQNSKSSYLSSESVFVSGGVCKSCAAFSDIPVCADAEEGDIPLLWGRKEVL